jgi:hypothetical protein
MQAFIEVTNAASDRAESSTLLRAGFLLIGSQLKGEARGRLTQAIHDMLNITQDWMGGGESKL